MIRTAVRRFGLIVLGLAVGVLLVFGFGRAAGRYRAAHPEITLRDGTLLQVEGLTWGANQVLRLEPVWWSALKQRLPPAWQVRLGPPVGTRWGGDVSETSLWLSRLDPIKGNYLPIDLSGISTLDATDREFGTGGEWASGPGRAGTWGSFDTVDWRAEALRFRVPMNGGVHDFSLPNPRRRERFPVWMPEQLPQTRQVGAFTFTLGDFKGKPPGEPEWQPPLAIATDGRDVSAWFHTEQMFSDPTGNRDRTRLPAGERVWRLEVTAYPSAHFPLPSERAIRLGRFTIPGPGKFLLVPPPPILTATNAWLEWACLTGPGSFSFRDGENQLSYAPGKGSAGNSTSMGSFWSWSADKTHPQLHVLLRGLDPRGTLLPGTTNRAARIVMRATRADGTILGSYGRRPTWGRVGNMTTQLISFDFAPETQGGPLNLDLFVIEPLKVDFTFAAPGVK